MKNHIRAFLLSVLMILIFGCSDDEDIIPPWGLPEKPTPGVDTIQLPVVIHVIHNGQAIGVGPNLSTERIERQIEILNEDFRRKEGTRGYNEHPDGADTKIEFVLAKSNPESMAINGINRIDASTVEVENLGYHPIHYEQYAFWDPNKYINIWTTPLPEEVACLVLGTATGPLTDLPGTELLSVPPKGYAEGILVHWKHFGESDVECHAKYGRTLTHEMGHFMGLLHPWAGNDCENNDYCEDTPAVDRVVFGRDAFIGCEGEPIMIGNYMNWSEDEVMNIFTNDQTERMYYVLNNNEGRKYLMTSPALN